MKLTNLNTRFGRLISILVAIVVATSPLLAQQRHNASKQPAAEPSGPAPTFDTLLAADSFKVYCEVRSVGALVRSAAVSDLLDPIMKLGGPPKEFKEFVTWLNAHSDTLAGSRMMVAGWPSRPNLPTVLVAIEFSTPEEAKKFFPELRDFLPTLLPTPTPSPSPTPTPKPANSAVLGGTHIATPGTAVTMVAPPQQIASVAETDTAPPAPPYKLKQVGSLILISDSAFNLRNLNPRDSKPLAEDQNFLLARNRFASESIFLYIDVNSIEKEEQERRKGYEEEEQKRIEEEARNPPKPEEPPAVEEAEVPSAEEQASPPVAEATIDSEQPAELVASVQPPANEVTGSEPSHGEQDDPTPLLYGLYGAFFGGENKWPEAIGASLVFENDAYVVRTLIINGAETKNNAIPFVPQFVSGPAITPESANIFPADTDLFVSVSLDYPQIYEGMVKSMAHAQEQMMKNSRVPVSGGLPKEAPFASYEKKLGIKIKDDLLPLLGNELALAIPKKAATTVAEAPPNPGDEKSGSTNPPVPVQNPNPVIAISIKDREAVGKLIPKIIEGFGLKGASMLAQSEKRDGTEIVSYAGVFSYAFVGDFLVISPDPAETRRVVDAYLNHQTLASDSHFRNATRWQPRQMQAQVFVSPSFVEQYLTGGGGYGANVNEKTSEFLARVNPTIDPITYSLTNDGLGPLHEMRVPKNLLMLQVVAISAQASEALPTSNERVAKSVLRSVASAEAAYKETANGYGTVDQLVTAGLLSKEMLEKYGYKIEITASKDKFEITAVPVEYGQTGKLSYFLDETQILRGGDHGGGTATVADQPLE
jgi:hypothetical protein